MAATPLLVARGLTFDYPQRPLFSQLDLDLLPGLTLLRGGDGTGKTTLLRLLAGVLQAQAGTLQAGEASLQTAPQAYRAQVFWADPRNSDHDQQLPADAALAVAGAFPGWNAAGFVDHALALGLEPHLHKPLYMLSTGSKRKVWLAAAFAAGAPVTLLDMPFAALDKPSIQAVTDRLLQAARDPARALLLADWEAPPQLPLRATLDLGD